MQIAERMDEMAAGKAKDEIDMRLRAAAAKEREYQLQNPNDTQKFGSVYDQEVEAVKSSYFNFPQRKYLPLKAPDLSGLSGQEIEIMEQVLNRLSDMNATQISEYSHRDVPWQTAKEGKAIEYESVFYRTPEYSVREYGTHVQ